MAVKTNEYSPYTMEELRNCTETTVSIYRIARLIGISAERLISQAREDQTKLSFPVIVAYDTVRVPRKPFIKFLEGEI